MMSISVEAAEARDSLTDDKEIVNTYEVRLVLDPKSLTYITTAKPYPTKWGGWSWLYCKILIFS